MQTLERRKTEIQLILLCSAVYFCCYLTRINFGASLTAIIQSEGYEKSALSLVTTALFITYGLGQLVSGFAADRMPPRLLIGAGLGVSSLMNILLPFCPSIPWMTAVWALNGLAQAMVWPPMVKVMIQSLSGRAYCQGTVWVSWGSSIATVVIYLIVPAVLAVSGWKSVFFGCAAAGLCLTALWFWGSRILERRASLLGISPDAAPEQTEPSANAPAQVRATARLLIPALAAIVMQGILRDGITTWMPTYIYETFHLDSATSILTGVVMPIFGIICYQFGSAIYRKNREDEAGSATMIFAVGGIAAAVLCFATDRSAVLSVLLSSLIVGCMHGVNLMYIGYLPRRFAAGGVATVSGILNFGTYVGSAISSYGVAAVSEQIGWQGTIGLWAVIAFAGMGLSILCRKLWRPRS